MQTTMQPLFEKYIPAMKNAALMDEVGAWVDKNPGATREMIADQTLRASKSMDNRFGLLNYDNNFWNPFIKQTGQVLMLAPGYQVGNIREIPGGLAGAATHPSRMSIGSAEHDPRIAYNAAMAVTWGLVGAAYQYLKTGKPPSSMADYLGPQTGGKLPNGMAERMRMPGYQNDVMHWMTDPVGTVASKLHPAIKTGLEVLQNQDFKGSPIANPNDPIYKRWEQYAGHVLEAFAPISLQTARKGIPPGSNISLPERMIAQTTPQSARNRAIYPPSRQETERNAAIWKNKQKYDAKQAAARNF